MPKAWNLHIVQSHSAFSDANVIVIADTEEEAFAIARNRYEKGEYDNDFGSIEVDGTAFDFIEVNSVEGD